MMGLITRFVIRTVGDTLQRHHQWFITQTGGDEDYHSRIGFGPDNEGVLPNFPAKRSLSDWEFSREFSQLQCREATEASS